jgi:hypothetical protein
VVTSLTEVLLLGAGLLLMPRGVFGRDTLRFVVRAAAAGIVMGAVIWPVRDSTILVSVPLGAAAYVAAALALRLISRSDLEWVRAVLSRRSTGSRASPTTPGAEEQVRARLSHLERDR